MNMLNYEIWKRKMDRRNHGLFLNEDNYLLEIGEESYLYSFLRQDGEELLKKAEGINVICKDLCFESFSTNVKEKVTEAVYSLIFNYKNAYGWTTFVEVEAEYILKDKKIWFNLYIDEDFKENFGLFPEEHKKFNNFLKSFIDLISSKEEYRLLLLIGNLEKVINSPMEEMFELYNG